MRLSEAQLNLFWRLWSRACRAQGWTREKGLGVADVNEKRRGVLKELGFESLTHVDGREGFDRVKARLMVLADSVQGAMEEVDTDLGRRRRLLEKVQHLIRCLSLYMDRPDAEKYVARICQDKFAWRGAITRNWEELDHRPRGVWPSGAPRWSELDELIATINGRLNGRRGFRARAEQSVHDMLTAAGLPCDCRACAGTVVVQSEAAVEAVQSAPKPAPRRARKAAAVPAAADGGNPF